MRHRINIKCISFDKVCFHVAIIGNLNKGRSTRLIDYNTRCTGGCPLVKAIAGFGCGSYSHGSPQIDRHAR